MQQSARQTSIGPWVLSRERSFAQFSVEVEIRKNREDQELDNCSSASPDICLRNNFCWSACASRLYTYQAMTALSRRDFAKLITAAGVGANLPLPAQNYERTVAIQVGAVSFVDEGLAAVLDRFQNDAKINTLLIASFSCGRGIAGSRFPDSHCLTTASRNTTATSTAAISRARMSSTTHALRSKRSRLRTIGASMSWRAFCRKRNRAG